MLSAPAPSGDIPVQRSTCCCISHPPLPLSRRVHARAPPCNRASMGAMVAASASAAPAAAPRWPGRCGAPVRAVSILNFVIRTGVTQANLSQYGPIPRWMDTARRRTACTSICCTRANSAWAARISCIVAVSRANWAAESAAAAAAPSPPPPRGRRRAAAAAPTQELGRRHPV
jgi:hypothetical protein